MEPPSGPGVRRILFAAAILAAVFFLSKEGTRPPAPKPANAPATKFSAGRALQVLNELVGNGVPHPIGSPANDALRGHILEMMSALGYAPQVQTAFDCNDYGECATVNNIEALLPGSETGPAVLLAAHYDSVPAGPGAFDDTAGVAAVLEIARALKSLPTPRHSIILLIDEGEEPGLLGARAFVDQNPWAGSVRAAVNLDARGTSGPSLMFETGRANAWVVDLYAKRAARPAASSIFYTIYKQLPNDTDFTIFKAAGYEGLNFAVIGDVSHYHTRLDNLENASAASLQHQGDNAFASLLALANADLSNPPTGEAVYFDVFGHWTIRWPARWSPPMAEIGALLLLFQIGWMIWRKRFDLREYLYGLLEWLVIIAVTGLLAFFLEQLLRRAGALPVNWLAHPLPLLTAIWWLPIAVVVTHGMVFARRAGFWASWAGIWTWWVVLAVLIAWQTPGMSYVLLVPSLIAGVAALPFTFRRSRTPAGYWLVALLPLGAAAIVSFSAILEVYPALGNQSLVFLPLVVALTLTPCAPLCRDIRNASGLARLALPMAPITILALAVFAATVVPAYSAKAPEHVNMEYWMDADSGKPQWIVFPESGRLPEPIRLAVAFHRLDPGPFPWSTGAAFIADAPHTDLAAPTFTIQESSEADGKRTYRALLRSERGASDAIVMFPPGTGVDSVRVEGLPVEPETDRVRHYLNGWTIYESPTMPAKGIEISFQLPTGKPVELQVLDETPGLPAEGLFLQKARPLTATPFSEGDLMIVSRRVQLNP